MWAFLLIIRHGYAIGFPGLKFRRLLAELLWTAINIPVTVLKVGQPKDIDSVTVYPCLAVLSSLSPSLWAWFLASFDLTRKVKFESFAPYL